MPNKGLLLLIILLITSLLPFCCSDEKGCDDKDAEQKYIFYEVNPAEGFNLRRDVFMRFLIMVYNGHVSGSLRNWRLVLPPFPRMYHWKEATKPLYWGEFFNVSLMKSSSPVVEMYEVFDEVKKNQSKTLQIDSMYILQNYKDAFDSDGNFREKWEFNANDECEYNGNFWGFKNVTVKRTYCVRFQGNIKHLKDLIFSHRTDKKVMFVNGEIPLHEEYGSQLHWDLRRIVKFHNKYYEAARKFILDKFSCENTKCNDYVSVHWRRGDFALSRNNLVPSVNGTAKQIDEKIKQYTPNIKKIFIATDAKVKEYVLLEDRLKKFGYEVYKFKPKVTDIGLYKEGGLAIIDQIICARSAYFIGTHESTFTFRIQEERELIGQDSHTTFNRLCPDMGRCERMSVWKALPASQIK